MKYVERTLTGLIPDNLNCSEDKTVQFFYKKQKQKKENKAFTMPSLKRHILCLLSLTDSRAPQCFTDQVKQRW